MSHHFDTPTVREDPRLNLCDLYVFSGATPETTALVMTVNPSATARTAAPFRDEAVYAVRFDTDDDRSEDISFKVRFGSAESEPSYEVYYAERQPGGLNGRVVARGRIGSVTSGDDGVRVFVGVVDDPFAGDATALHAFKSGFAKGCYAPEAFTYRDNSFLGRTIAAIVLEVPNRLISRVKRVRAWATVSLYGHAPEQQVARWGLPLLTHVFLSEGLLERFNRSAPGDDDSDVTADIETTVRRYTTLARTVTDPGAYAQRVVEVFGSCTLPYELGSVAVFGYAGFNGRSLKDNVMDVMLSILTNTPLGVGIRPDPDRVLAQFPYLRAAGSRV